MRSFNYSIIREQKWDSEILGTVNSFAQISSDILAEV